jgi:hypothetical protein
MQQDEFIAHTDDVRKLEEELHSQLELAKITREKLEKEQNAWQVDREAFLARMKAEKENEMAAYARKIDQDMRRMVYEAQKSRTPNNPETRPSSVSPNRTATPPMQRLKTPPRYGHHRSTKSCRSRAPVLMGTFEVSANPLSIRLLTYHRVTMILTASERGSHPRLIQLILALGPICPTMKNALRQ